MSLDTFAFLSIVCIFLILMSAYIKSTNNKEKSVNNTVGCPGTGTGKLHKWVPNLTEGGSICTICNKSPGSFYEED